MVDIVSTKKIKSQKTKWNPIAIVIATVAIYFISQAIASTVLIFTAILMGVDKASIDNWLMSSSWANFIFVVIADMLIILGVSLLLRYKKQNFKMIGIKKPHISDVGRALSAYVVYVVLFIVLSIFAKIIFPAVDLNQAQELAFQANRGIINLILAGISLVILPPIVEEILTRGFLYTGLRSRLNMVHSAIITSIVFAIAHLQFGSQAPLLWVAAIDTFTLSIVLVYLREKTGSLAAPMLLHMIKNALAFSLLFIFV